MSVAIAQPTMSGKYDYSHPQLRAADKLKPGYLQQY
jgi:hypothetical protein